jgi:MFS family permease
LYQKFPISRRLIGQVNWRWRESFTALKYRNYRLWFFGQMISLFGTWMQMSAQGYLVFQLTHSPAYLGYLAFVTGIPTWMFMVYAGVIADRVSRRTVLVITQTYMMILAFILATLTFTDIVQPWQIMILAFGLGLGNAFDAPARQAIVFELVEREDLANAIALNSAMFNSAMAVGPAVSGVTYALLGPAWCFTINGLTFIAVIIALLLMKLKPRDIPLRGTSTLSELKEGFQYVFSHPVIRTIIILVAMTSMFGFSFVTLIPAWAVRILQGNETTNGLLYSARGIGALIGALGIASLGRFTFKGKLLTVGMFVFPLGLLIFTWVRWLPLSLLTLAGVGAALILVVNLANALVQMLLPDQLRGRVMGIYTFAFLGIMPIGGLLAGTIAEHFGGPITIAFSSLILLGFAMIVWISVPKLRTLE